MFVKKLQKLALEKISVRKATSVDEIKKEIITRVLLEMIRNSDNLQCLKNNLEEANFHVCALSKFDVWHGKVFGPRKFRRKSLCKCKCAREGPLCECSCGALWKMLMEYRETEFYRCFNTTAFRRIFDGKKMVIVGKHKKSVRFIPKNTMIGELLSNQFMNPY